VHEAGIAVCNPPSIYVRHCQCGAFFSINNNRWLIVGWSVRLRDGMFYKKRVVF